jgi:signal transduction histidine kinase
MIHLLLLKKAIRKLTKDYKCSKENIQGEQHVLIGLYDNDLELLAEQLNKSLENHFIEKYNHNQSVQSIKQEITNLSHDLRTPLTSILGYIDFVKSDNLTQEQVAALGTIKQRALQLNHLIDQLYEYTRLENDEISLHLEQIDLYKILREHLLSYYYDFAHHDIVLDLQLPPENQPVWITGDIKSIERVLSNLTSNAIKYSGGNTLVALKAENNQVVLTYRTARQELSHYDILHLFDKFYKQDIARSNTKSSGLGLTISKLYIEKMKGKMEALGDDEYLYISCSFQN